MSERDRVELLRRLFDGASRGVLVDIGDDAAVVDAGGAPLAWSIDAMVEDVHFRRSWLDLSALGFKATMAAASDLAAMGARPLGVLAALVLPAGWSDDDLAELAAGQAEAAQALGTRVIGGNMARGPSLSITTTVLGACGARILEREGAKAGDALWCAGAIGLAAAGLGALVAGHDDAALVPALAAWRRPTARIQEGLAAQSLGHAAIDVSDGLSLDASRLLDPSLDLVLDAAALVTTELAAAAGAISADPLDLALCGGEDYALLVAAPEGAALDGFVRIGCFELGTGALHLDRAGTRTVVQPRGFDHFA